MSHALCTKKKSSNCSKVIYLVNAEIGKTLAIFFSFSKTTGGHKANSAEMQ